MASKRADHPRQRHPQPGEQRAPAAAQSSEREGRIHPAVARGSHLPMQKRPKISPEQVVGGELAGDARRARRARGAAPRRRTPSGASSRARRVEMAARRLKRAQMPLAREEHRFAGGGPAGRGEDRGAQLLEALARSSPTPRRAPAGGSKPRREVELVVDQSMRCACVAAGPAAAAPARPLPRPRTTRSARASSRCVRSMPRRSMLVATTRAGPRCRPRRAARPRSGSARAARRAWCRRSA